jgi:hypothetical protein
MSAKHWKEILIFSFSLGITIMLLLTGEKYFGKDYTPIVFSIFFMGTIASGIWLKTKLDFEIDFDKIMTDIKREPTEKELEEREKWAGKLEIENQDLVFKHGGDQQVKIEISDIKIIGEFTTDADPIATDWYLIIVKKNNEVIYLPAYAVGLQETLKQLSDIFNHEIVPKLFASVKFDSNVIYPKSIDGKKLFQFEGLNPKGIWEKIKVNLGFSPITPILRNEIIELKE